MLIQFFFQRLRFVSAQRRLDKRWGASQLLLVTGLLGSIGTVQTATAAVLPGPADAARVEQEQNFTPAQPDLLPPISVTHVLPTPTAPDSAKTVSITVDRVDVTGMTVFTPAQVQDIFAPYLGHPETLDVLWTMADKLTARYREQGYFLSRATVPQQELTDGNVTLHVTEGYIGDIQLDSKLAANRIVRQWLSQLKQDRPLKADELESILLQLDDLPGVDLHSVLEPLNANADGTGDDGAVRLVLEPRDVKPVTGQISFDNDGSRFLGPYEMQAQAQIVTAPGYRMTLNGLVALPLNELQYGGIKQELPIWAGWTGELYASHTHAEPGYILKRQEIHSTSYLFGAAVDYQIIRQRQENLSARFAFESQNSDSTALGTPLSQDAVRAVRASLTYERADAWLGQNVVAGTLSQGVNVFGASQPAQLNLSRFGTRPDFFKFAVNASRLQGITDDWSVYGAMAAQLSPKPLYSSEQFGYGGQAFGRAYDSSEITGDQGVDGSVELRYGGIKPWRGIQPSPYTFYDIGEVWNHGLDPTYVSASGSSAGAGLRLLTDFGLAANGGLGFPLTRRIANPIDGNGKNPRYFFNLSYAF